jgi:predicted AlkP superfamily phosphohydrolase/phosphomutase
MLTAGRGRLVIVGLDGMPYRLMKTFGEDGTMPHFGQLAREGCFRPMASSIPEISSVAWSSVITGKNPGEHGIYGFTALAPGTYRRTFPNFSALKAQPFWEREPERRAIIINVPMTFPAREMNGALIAGFVALDLERATFPRSLVPRLRAMDYRVDVDAKKAHQSLDLFLQDLERTLQARIATYRYLWREESWDTFMLVFTGTDRLAHFLWDAYGSESHPYRAAFLAHFRQIDAAIGEIVGRLGPHDALIMLSDHGFERLEQNVYVNHTLRTEGFLSFEDDSTPSLRGISKDARAFALDPGRIYLHRKAAYPKGNIEPADEAALLDDLVTLFESLEWNGERVIQRAFRKEEIYAGPQIDLAPDLVLLGNRGYNLRGKLGTDQLFGKDAFAGKHSQADAFLLAWGENANHAMPQNPCVSDVVSGMNSIRS